MQIKTFLSHNKSTADIVGNEIFNKLLESVCESQFTNSDDFLKFYFMVIYMEFFILFPEGENCGEGR